MLNMALGAFQQYSSVIDVNNLPLISRILQTQEWLQLGSNSDLAASLYVYRGYVRGWAQFVEDNSAELEKFILRTQKHRSKTRSRHKKESAECTISKSKNGARPQKTTELEKNSILKVESTSCKNNKSGSDSTNPNHSKLCSVKNTIETNSPDFILKNLPQDSKDGRKSFELNSFKASTISCKQTPVDILQKCINKGETPGLVKGFNDPAMGGKILGEISGSHSNDNSGNTVEARGELFNPVSTALGLETKIVGSTVSSSPINKELVCSPLLTVIAVDKELNTKGKNDFLQNHISGSESQSQIKIRCVKTEDLLSVSHKKKKKSSTKCSVKKKNFKSEEPRMENKKTQKLMSGYTSVELQKKDGKNSFEFNTFKASTISCKQTPVDILQNCINKGETPGLVKGFNDRAISCGKILGANSDSNLNDNSGNTVEACRELFKPGSTALDLEIKIVGSNSAFNSSPINKELVCSPLPTVIAVDKQLNSKRKNNFLLHYRSGDEANSQIKMKSVKTDDLMLSANCEKKKKNKDFCFKMKYSDSKGSRTENQTPPKLITYHPDEFREDINNVFQNKITNTENTHENSLSSLGISKNEIEFRPAKSSVINKKKSSRYYTKKYGIKKCFVVLKRLKLTPELLCSLSVSKFESNYSFFRQTDLQIHMVREKTEKINDSTTKVMNAYGLDDYCSNNLLLEKSLNININCDHIRMDDGASRKAHEVEYKSLISCATKSNYDIQNPTLKTSQPNNIKNYSNKLDKKDYSNHSNLEKSSLNVVKRKKDKCKENNNNLIAEQIKKSIPPDKMIKILKPDQLKSENIPEKIVKKSKTELFHDISEKIVKKSKTELFHESVSVSHTHMKKKDFKTTLNKDSTKHHHSKTYSPVSRTHKSYNNSHHKSQVSTHTKQSDKVHSGYLSLFKDLSTNEASSDKLTNKHHPETHSEAKKECMNKIGRMKALLEKTEINLDKSVKDENHDKQKKSENHCLLENKVLTGVPSRDELITDSLSVSNNNNNNTNNNNLSVDTVMHLFKTDRFNVEKQSNTHFSTKFIRLENSISSEDENQLKICEEDFCDEKINLSTQKLIHENETDQTGKANSQNNFNTNLDSRKRKYIHSFLSYGPVSKLVRLQNVLDRASIELKPVNFVVYMCWGCEKTFTQKKDWILHWEGTPSDYVCPQKK